MRLKTKYILYIIIIHLLLVGVTVIVFRQSKVLFLVCEAIIILSVFLSFRFYNALIRPFRLLNSGIDAIADKDFSMKILPVGQPELDRLIYVFNKMIEHLRLERAIASEKDFFLEKLIGASPASIIILDKKNTIKTINPAGIELLKLNNNNLLPETINQLPFPWNKELKKMNKPSSIVVQLDGINRYKCTRSHFIDKGVKQPFFLIEELTREIWEAEKKSYEKVIRMMSHEVNNTVGAVNSIISSSVDYLDSSGAENREDFIGAMKIAGERIISLNQFTKRFADIVHIPAPERVSCNVYELVQKVSVSYSIELKKKDIQLHIQSPDLLPVLLLDQQQMELVLVNILKNAMQSMTSGGKINIIIKEKPVTVIIENNGDAIPEKLQKKLFEPFFTTKKTGQGIGLTLIREVLTNHGCDFSLKTRSDGITEFRIEFDVKSVT